MDEYEVVAPQDMDHLDQLPSIKDKPMIKEFDQLLDHELFQEVPKLQETIATCHKALEECTLKLNKLVALKGSIHDSKQRFQQHQDQFEKDMATLQEAKTNWEEYRAKVKEIFPQVSQIVTLDVGGKQMKTTLEVLKSVDKSLLQATFSSEEFLNETEKGIFLDRDPEIFELLLNYLRNDRKLKIEFDSRSKQSLFLAELEYWQIETPLYLSNSQEEQKLDSGMRASHVPSTPVAPIPEQDLSKSTFSLAQNVHAKFPTLPRELIDLLHSDPAVTHPDFPPLALKKWKSLGPINFDTMSSESFLNLSHSLNYGVDQFEQGDYSGQFDKKGRREGIGRLVHFRLKQIIDGQFTDGALTGWCRVIFGNGQYYEGMVDKYKFHGYGKLVEPNGKVYKGDFFNGKPIEGSDYDLI